MLIITEVYDGLIAAMMKDEHHYLFRKDDEPYRFIGEDAAKRAVYWKSLMETEVPVNLTVHEALILSKLLEDCGEYCNTLGVQDCVDKLIKAVFDKTK